MIGFIKYKKPIAVLLCLIMSMEFILPHYAYALTSGPVQPEMKGFEPIGNTEMVDLFSGDFSYNIPLLDVGGYPVNLAYHSGANMDDEASWTGYGWSLNVGSLNRQLRGLPDDFNGTDKMEREMNMKKHVVKGAKFSMTIDLLGIPVERIKFVKKKKKLDLNMTFSIGIKHDNYRGIGMEIGANPGVSLTDYVADDKTSKDSTSIRSNQSVGGAGLNLSSMDGASVSLNANILKKNFEMADKQNGISKSVGFSYNTRAGLTGMTLSNSFSSSAKKNDSEKKFINPEYARSSSSFISFNGESYTPTIDHPMKSNSFTFSLHVGPELWVVLAGVGVTGFYSRQSVAEKFQSQPAYGYMHSEKGKDLNEAVMDFNREKDIPYSNEVKYLPIPVPTNDLFIATSQVGSGQYRAHRSGSGVYFDKKTESQSEDLSIGIEFGAGIFFDAGADVYHQSSITKTRKWTARNEFLPKGDFQDGSIAEPLFEKVFFKRVGEPVPIDETFLNKIKGESPVAVNLPANISNPIDGAKASDLLRTKNSDNGETITTLRKGKRDVRNTTFSQLSAIEASRHGLEKAIISYKPDSITLGNCNAGAVKSSISRVSGHRKPHHISEVTITADDGKRSVYGLPVYNTYQEEVSFSTSANLALRNKGLTQYTGQDNSSNNARGRENYYSKEKTPPYSTSHLLTAILSPDYIDKTGNGISDDDGGTAVKFNYTKHDSLYRWRTPFAFGQDTANYNEGFLSDELDDKANYVYGTKELWYLHSIESKTMVAHFVTEDRVDGLGVLDNRGAVNTVTRLKRLKEIRLYSKAELKLNGNDPSRTVPVKVVHFVYDYSTCPGLPNSISNTGKLTLRKVYFTFGQNLKGRLNPYTFHYDSSYNYYQYRQYDRWGNFKDVAENPGGLNNSEFPYTLQDSLLTDQFVSAWQLKKIILPTGGSINVTYESDDYAYVQDRRASQMCMVNGIGSQGSASGLVDAEYIFINLPFDVSSQSEMLKRYFEGITNLYYKFFLDLDGKGHKEFVPGYAEIVGRPELIGTNIAKIKLNRSGGVNPIARAGWQFIRTNLPKYAYPGSENLGDDGSDLVKAVKALVTAFGNIKELIYGFEKRARNKGFSNQAVLSKSWVRLCSPQWKKLGGGNRVKRIDISDDWENMSGATGAKTTAYSQVYDYTTTEPGKGRISSGVASYEPLIGNDENPFRQPVRYSQKQFLGLDNYYYIEEPFGESFFPAATVGYSRVTVRSIGSDDEETDNRTGTMVSEFFTARDYPVRLDNLPLRDRKPFVSKIFKLIGSVSYDMVGLSQGYSIVTNDMHGKPKSVNVFNKGGQNISSVEYYYKSKNELAPSKDLANSVKVIDATGTVSDGTIGLDVEMFSDMRDHSTDNLGKSIKVSGGSGAILIFPLPFFFPGFDINYDVRSYRASSSVKIINRFGIQYKVIRKENGSSITSENLLWDAETGNVLLTKTQNEFDDPVYSFAYPAHWIFGRMGQAYTNLGTVINGFSTTSTGTISNSVYNDVLIPGDELIDINSTARYWVINSPIGGVYQNRVIDNAGDIKQVSGLSVKLVRSGNRNMANTAVATIASLKNPIVGNELDVSELTRVLDAKATVFTEEWSVPVPSVPGIDSSACGIDEDCLHWFIGASLCYYNSIGTSPMLNTGTGLTAGDILNNVYSGPSCFSDFLNGQPASEVEFYQYYVKGEYPKSEISNGDSAYFGGCKMHFDSVTATFIQLANSVEDSADLAAAHFQVGPDFTVDCGFIVYAGSPLARILKFHIVCPPDTSCLDPVNRKINPYLAGILGNWRPKSQYAYHVARENPVTDPGKFGSTDIRKAGAYSVFSPFWSYGSGWTQTSDEKWISANEITLINQKGLELENKDALNRYSSALFGYLESLPIAVASNARFNDIGFDGFEDYAFDPACNSSDTCNNSGHFRYSKLINGTSVDTSRIYAHTGNYSLKLSSSVTLVKPVYSAPDSLYTFSSAGNFLLGYNPVSNGFSPEPGKKYVLSFWIRDGNPRDPSTSVQATVNGTNLVNGTVKWPIVEGWKRIEVPFTFSSLATNFTLQLSPGAGTVYFDDIRIHPFDGQMKTFVYDAATLRLMAEQDENNFSTFYEYDDEGILIRLKKETERGIMTIRETRSSYKKQ